MPFFFTFLNLKKKKKNCLDTNILFCASCQHLEICVLKGLDSGHSCRAKLSCRFTTTISGKIPKFLLHQLFKIFWLRPSIVKYFNFLIVIVIVQYIIFKLIIFKFSGFQVFPNEACATSFFIAVMNSRPKQAIPRPLNITFIFPGNPHQIRCNNSIIQLLPQKT